jgi:hypothetical protein
MASTYRMYGGQFMYEISSCNKVAEEYNQDYQGTAAKVNWRRVTLCSLKRDEGKGSYCTTEVNRNPYASCGSKTCRQTDGCDFPSAYLFLSHFLKVMHNNPIKSKQQSYRITFGKHLFRILCSASLLHKGKLDHI